MNKEYTTILHVDSRYAVRRSNVDFYVPFTGLGDHALKDADGNFIGVPGGNTAPGEVFRDVTSVELHAIRFDGTDLTTVPYVIMDVDELNNNTFSNVPQANRSFAVIHTVHDNFNRRTVKFDLNDKVRYFEPALTTLSRLTIRLRTPDGPLPFDGFVSMIIRIRHKRPV